MSRRRARHLVILAAVAVAAVIGGLTLGASSHRAAAARAPQLVTRRLAPTARVARLVLPTRPDVRLLRIPVLMYHRVTWPIPDTPNGREFIVPPSKFAAEMDWLQTNGYHPISQATLFRALAEGGKLPDKPVVITVDDGYVDGVHAILHGLVTRTRHWPAAFFIITGRIGRGEFLSWPDLHLLESAGMDIGSHTVFHTPLAQLTPAQLRFELTQSRKTLQAGLGHPVYWFAYPYGSVDQSAQAAVEKAGYLLAYTTVPGVWLSFSQRVALPRINVPGTETLAQFAATLGP